MVVRLPDSADADAPFRNDVDLGAARLRLADLRSFAEPQAGVERRATLTAYLQSWLTDHWNRATNGLRPEGLALAAVGSLARGEVGPLSDLDLVLLHSGRALPEKDVIALADRLWYPLWDSGVRLDHSVRTVAQCRSVAANDLTATIGLLDLAWIGGDRDLVASARSTVAHDWRASARRRLPALLEPLSARHLRHGDLGQSLEPDLKESKGGLRDLTVIAALAEAWLTDKPSGDVEAARTLLLDVRDAIHVVTARGRDRLVREDHDAIASVLGHDDADELLTQVSAAGRVIAHTLDGSIRRASQAQRARTLRVGPRRPQMIPLGHGLFVSDGEVVLGHERLLDDPLTPLRTAVLAARVDLPIAPVTVANLTRVPDLPTPWPTPARELFAELLGAGPGLLRVWESLDQAGLIARWMPEWVAVRSRPQRSAVHRHTVDRHLLESVVVAAGLVRRVARPDLLLLAALLHDIGKVRGARDHSAEGAPVAAAMASRLGFDASDAGLIELLVREHLTLIELATRRDHADPRTVDAALDAVADDPAAFELLLALTEADACAAGPAAWTDWRATLLRQLGEAVRRRLRESVSRQHDLLPPLAPVDLPADNGVTARREEGRTLVAQGRVGVWALPGGGAWRLDIVAGDRLGLFADTAGLLAAEGLLVRTAILRTVDDLAVNEWHVESPSGQAPDTARIARGLERLSTGERRPLTALTRREQESGGSRTAGHHEQARALLVPGASAEATVLEVRAEDRRGLLHDIGKALAAASISVRSAHIATHAGQTLDTFYLTQPQGGPLPPATVGRVIGIVIDACEKG